jgi:Mn-containing catalase
MYFNDPRLQFPVRVETPNPLFARALQQAIGGVEGEIRVCMQYFFQGWGARGPKKYRDLLLATATEEIGHIEMLATAVALNLEGAPLDLQEAVSADAVGGAVLNGVNFQNILSSGLNAMPVNSDGVPFDMSHIYASGNLAADMTANVAAESTGRVLAVRLYNMTSDPGMKEMLQFLIARDTHHQNQWMAVLEDMGGVEKNFPIPNSHPEAEQNNEFAYTTLGFEADGSEPPEGRWTAGKSIDGKGSFSARPMEPLGDEPQLPPARPNGGAQTDQVGGGGSLASKVKEALT